MDVTIFCSKNGVGHTHTVTRFEPSRHRVDVDRTMYWCSEIITVAEAVAQACAGRLKRVS
jgi:hypothetical protein